MTSLHNIAHRTKKLPPLRVGIGGPVGSGKTTLLEMLCKAMRERYDLIAITNDIYTKEDQRLLTVSGALPAERIMGVETGGCPHTAIREDASINLEAIDRMLGQFPNADVVFIESGGDNLAAKNSSQRRSWHHQKRFVCHQQNRSCTACRCRLEGHGSRHPAHASHGQRRQALCDDQLANP